MPHYMNGREAKENDSVICAYGDGISIAGRIYRILTNSETCNATIAAPCMGGCQTLCCTVKECLHAEDALAAFKAAPHPISAHDFYLEDIPDEAGAAYLRHVGGEYLRRQGLRDGIVPQLTTDVRMALKAWVTPACGEYVEGKGGDVAAHVLLNDWNHPIGDNFGVVMITYPRKPKTITDQTTPETGLIG